MMARKAERSRKKGLGLHSLQGYFPKTITYFTLAQPPKASATNQWETDRTKPIVHDLRETCKIQTIALGIFLLALIFP